MRWLRRSARVALALFGAVILAGCVSIPRSGPVIRADQATTQASSQVEIAPQAPAPDASPRAVVEGFLQAMAAYEPDYATARLYLAASVRDSWQPTSGVTVYADGHAPTETDGTVRLSAPVTGRVDARGAYTPASDRIDTDFGLQRGEDGQWRISQPPEGLVVSQFVFDNFFQHVNLYWPEPGNQFLVPDPISLAHGRLSAATLVGSLLAGPGGWLGPAVRSALPENTRLASPVDLDQNGVVTVDLSGPLETLDLQQRRLLVGQLTWTLDQIPTVTGVRVLANGEQYPLGDLTDPDGVVAIEALPSLSPVPTGLDNHLFALSEGQVVRVEQSERSTNVSPVAGSFGQPGVEPESLAVTPSGDAVAVVTDGGTRVTTFAVASGDTTASLMVPEGLLRPQYARTGELWLVSGAPGAQRMQISSGGVPRDVEIGALAEEHITDFRLSPDGVRIALVLEREGARIFALARVERQGDTVRLDGLRVIPLVTKSRTELTDISDVGWIGAGRLVLLATGEGSTQPSPYRLDLNAMAVQQIGQADRWQADSIATLATSEAPRMVIVGGDGRAWRYEDDFTWPQLPQQVTAAAYPG